MPGKTNKASKRAALIVQPADFDRQTDIRHWYGVELKSELRTQRSLPMIMCHKPHLCQRLILMWVSMVPGKSWRGMCGWQWCPMQIITASNVCFSLFPSLFSVSTSHWPEWEKLDLCFTCTTLVWVAGWKRTDNSTDVRHGWCSNVSSDISMRWRKSVKRPHVEAYVLVELEVSSIHPKVVNDEGVVHVVWEVCRDGIITETHHLLGGVDDDRVVDAGSVRFGILLQETGIRLTSSSSCTTSARLTHLEPPQTSDVIAALEADRLQSFIQAALDAGETWTTSSDHCYTSSHCPAVWRMNQVGCHGADAYRVMSGWTVRLQTLCTHIHVHIQLPPCVLMYMLQMIICTWNKQTNLSVEQELFLLLIRKKLYNV